AGSRSTNGNTMPATSTSTSGNSSRSTKVRSRSNGPSNASRSSSSSRTDKARRQIFRWDGPSLRYGHARAFGGRTPHRFALPSLPEELPPDEERARADEEHDRHPRVQPHPGELRPRVDPQQLLEEAPERVQGDVEREERRRLDPEPPVDEQQDPDHSQVVEQLVEEGRMKRLVLPVAGAPMLRVDLEPPRGVGRLPIQLLVEPVADAPDPLREQEARRRGIGEDCCATTRAPDDDPA